MRLIDLHTHSTASDGSHPPAEVARLAKEADLAAVALTDHDTVDGVEEFMAAGAGLGIETIAGCELSVEGQGASMHILGLWVGSRPGRLSATLAELREHRHNRNRIILDKLASCGIAIDYAQVEAKAGGTVGRPHIAEVMIELGACRNFQECFNKYLGHGGLAYEPKKCLSAGEAIALLHEDGATTVLAHPMYLGISGEGLAAKVRDLKDLGLDAIEAYYSDHDPRQTQIYLDLAAKLGLGVCGGSDFHGAAKPRTVIGRGSGNLRIPERVLYDLKAQRLRLGLPA